MAWQLVNVENGTVAKKWGQKPHWIRLPGGAKIRHKDHGYVQDGYRLEGTGDDAPPSTGGTGTGGTGTVPVPDPSTEGDGSRAALMRALIGGERDGRPPDIREMFPGLGDGRTASPPPAGSVDIPLRPGVGDDRPVRFSTRVPALEPEIGEPDIPAYAGEGTGTEAVRRAAMEPEGIEEGGGEPMVAPREAWSPTVNPRAVRPMSAAQRLAGALRGVPDAVPDELRDLMTMPALRPTRPYRPSDDDLSREFIRELEANARAYRVPQSTPTAPTESPYAIRTDLGPSRAPVENFAVPAPARDLADFEALINGIEGAGLAGDGPPSLPRNVAPNGARDYSDRFGSEEPLPGDGADFGDPVPADPNRGLGGLSPRVQGSLQRGTAAGTLTQGPTQVRPALTGPNRGLDQRVRQALIGPASPNAEWNRDRQNYDGPVDFAFTDGDGPRQADYVQDRNREALFDLNRIIRSMDPPTAEPMKLGASLNAAASRVPTSRETFSQRKYRESQEQQGLRERMAPPGLGTPDSVPYSGDLPSLGDVWGQIKRDLLGSEDQPHAWGVDGGNLAASGLQGYTPERQPMRMSDIRPTVSPFGPLGARANVGDRQGLNELATMGIDGSGLGENSPTQIVNGRLWGEFPREAGTTDPALRADLVKDYGRINFAPGSFSGPRARFRNATPPPMMVAGDGGGPAGVTGGAFAATAPSGRRALARALMGGGPGPAQPAMAAARPGGNGALARALVGGFNGGGGGGFGAGAGFRSGGAYAGAGYSGGYSGGGGRSGSVASQVGRSSNVGTPSGPSSGGQVSRSSYSPATRSYSPGVSTSRVGNQSASTITGGSRSRIGPSIGGMLGGI